jgi:RNA recognition motif-containing protein
MNIFVGNLSAQTTEKQLENLFTPFGAVQSVKIITDNYTGRSRGFAFVEMPERTHAETAIAKLNNSSLDTQSITVNEARPKNSNESFGRKR